MSQLLRGRMRGSLSIAASYSHTLRGSAPTTDSNLCTHTCKDDSATRHCTAPQREQTHTAHLPGYVKLDY